MGEYKTFNTLIILQRHIYSSICLTAKKNQWLF